MEEEIPDFLCGIKFRFNGYRQFKDIFIRIIYHGTIPIKIYHRIITFSAMKNIPPKRSLRFIVRNFLYYCCSTELFLWTLSQTVKKVAAIEISNWTFIIKNVKIYLSGGEILRTTIPDPTVLERIDNYCGEFKKMDNGVIKMIRN